MSDNPQQPTKDQKPTIAIDEEMDEDSLEQVSGGITLSGDSGIVFLKAGDTTPATKDSTGLFTDTKGTI